jgi:probable rRNA maturation factor
LRPVAVTNRHRRLRFEVAEVQRVIHVLDTQHEKLVPSGLRTLLCGAGRRAELSVVFMTDIELAGLHGAFLDDPTTTDVITFEPDVSAGMSPEDAGAGEICVSVDTASAYAREHGRDFAAELTLYVVHGWLHLAGHDDLVPQKKRAMRRAEARALALLKSVNAIPRFTLRRS